MKMIRRGKSVFAIITILTVITMFSASELFVSLNIPYTAYAQGSEPINEENEDTEPNDNIDNPGDIDSDEDDDDTDEPGDIDGDEDDEIDEPGDSDDDEEDDEIDEPGDSDDDEEDNEIDDPGDSDDDEEDDEIDDLGDSDDDEEDDEIDETGDIDGDEDDIDKPGGEEDDINKPGGTDGDNAGVPIPPEGTVPIQPEGSVPIQPDGGLQQRNDREILIDYLIMCAETLEDPNETVWPFNYSMEKIETVRVYIEKWLSELSDEEFLNIYIQYFGNLNEGELLIHELMKSLADGVPLEWPHLDGYRGQLLDYLMQESVVNADMYDTVVDFFVTYMWDVTAENLYSLIFNQRISADDAVEHILLLYDTYIMLSSPIMFLQSESRNDLPDTLVGDFIKDAAPDKDNFRRYEISLSFDVNPRTLREEGTVAELSGDKFKVSGSNKVLDDKGFNVLHGNDKINGVVIEDPSIDYFIQITNADNSVRYEKIEPNLIYIPKGDPDYQNASNTIWDQVDFPHRSLNVWIPGFDGNWFTLSDNKSFDDYMIFTSLPYSTTYNTITDVVITDTLPDGFHYVSGSIAMFDINGYALPISEAQETGFGTVNINPIGSYTADYSPYKITYEIQANDWILEDGAVLTVGGAAMNYTIVNAGPAKQAASNTAWLDVPPLIRIGIGIFDICYIGTDYVFDLKNINSDLIDYTPPSLADYIIPSSWQACYDTEAVKTGIKNRASGLITGGISNMTIGKGLNEEIINRDCTASADNYKVLANEYSMIYDCDVIIRILGVEGALTYSLMGIDGGLGFKPVSNGLFDILTICDGIQFQVGLHPGEKRIYKLRKDVNEEDFSATTYVPYGYSQSTLVTGSLNLADAIINTGTYDGIIAILKNGDENAIAALGDAIGNMLSIEVNVEVTKPNSPWFRDWAWKKQDGNEFESEIQSS